MPIPGNQPGPSWYDSAWRYRWPVAVDAVTGGNSGSVDITVVIPEAWDHFWDNVLEGSGFDIVVCGSDGRTLLTFDYNGLNLSTRTLTLEIQNFALNGTGKMEMIWLYWGNAAATTQITSFVPSSPLTGYVELSGPSGYSTVLKQGVAGATTPRVTWAKKSTETISGWLDLSNALSLYAHTYNGHFNNEGVYHAKVSVPAGSPALGTDTLTRYLYYDNRLWAVGNWSGGTDGTDYVAIYTITTTDGRILDYRLTLNVDDLT